ncbi:MAG: hypothetical protein JRI57_00210 [Deltaproteobacteria bacterium]|nr:hypothetical protein [Deltaproteobacteria bacterium]MBW1951493.1 hypothetical protein [Deltaproteobacteria bacterium]MBW1987413.1 hypothetical protein [Deltaproteobacteria bacterium]MBW2135032.1 hypothetical protein [Deltaproteobacteria bacterium]
MSDTLGEARLRANFAKIKEIISDQEMLERVPSEVLEFSPAHLEDLVKYAYFGGFIDMGDVRRLLLLERRQLQQRLMAWYEEVREKGCWLC